MMSALLLLALSALSSPALAADPVTLYYESLCPYCRDFIVGSFSTAWEAVPEIMAVTFVPWGNARSGALAVRLRCGCVCG